MKKLYEVKVWKKPFDFSNFMGLYDIPDQLRFQYQFEVGKLDQFYETRLQPISALRCASTLTQIEKS